ncbi:MAG: HD domain-containing protein [Bacteroidales bacterium]|nr:HD domain-containing protein [Bacteroidales bacterium]
MNKKKIINDPVYGFINLYDDIIYELIEHPLFQRLRRIKQLGLTHLVYPGATHTRFQHSLGSLHLMQSAISTIRSKGHEIKDEEAQAAKIAILLHDLGHGPFSHSLESNWVKDYSHEDFSLMMMNMLNDQWNGQLELAMKIYRNQHPKKFLHQLVSSQLDMDRLDYLRRDSFFTGVSEGVIGSDRIIKMLSVHDDQLVIEAKGIHSIEKFLIARWIMYWQVYFHKTVVSAEQLITRILDRAKELMQQGEDLPASGPLKYFLEERYHNDNREDMLKMYSKIDDTDLSVAVKSWSESRDRVLSLLCNNMLWRRLFKIELQKEPLGQERLRAAREEAQSRLGLSRQEVNYFVFTQSITNKAYSSSSDQIQILYKDNKVKDVAEASDMLSLPVLSKIVKKYFLCYPKEYNLNL